jgi:hypothetical protein
VHNTKRAGSGAADPVLLKTSTNGFSDSTPEIAKQARRDGRRRQLDLFIAEPASPILGLHVKIDRPIDRDRPCCENVCAIGPAKGPHAGELICADCGRHRGWLSKTTARWIEDVISRFGAPTTPIVVRTFHTYTAQG